MSTAPAKLFTIRGNVDEKLYDQVVAYAEKKGIPVSEAMAKLLETALGRLKALAVYGKKMKKEAKPKAPKKPKAVKPPKEKKPKAPKKEKKAAAPKKPRKPKAEKPAVEASAASTEAPAAE